MSIVSFTACSWFVAVAVRAADPIDAKGASAATVDFERDIRPIFESRCLECHGADTQESHLRLDRRSSLLRGGDSGEPAIVPGKSEQSHLIRLISGDDAKLAMPPEGERLSAKEIALIRAWIDGGAKWPGAENENGQVTTDFWSFQPLSRVTPPHDDAGWSNNEVDAFIVAGLKSAGLTPSTPAERRVLCRRLYLDVLGLAPTPEQLEEFVNDVQPDAWPRLVDRVLASPHYGERWGRHWLDVVRFAETDGFEMNQERPSAWRYRDYVISALNEDLPYNEFVFQQLAGDTVNADVATGFIVSGAFDKVKSPDPTLTLMQRQDELADMINTTGTAFLGLTLGCARCHNHKFDPVTQSDYYSLQAVFAGVQHGDRPLHDPAADERRDKPLAELDRRLGEVQSELQSLGVRPAVDSRQNIEEFAAVDAKFVRFSVFATNTIEPCIDELEIYADAAGALHNVALASNGARATASSTYPGSKIHRLEHINDGQYGNERSWISNEQSAGWVQIEFPQAAKIQRVVWGRDRNGQYTDRLATDYLIEASLDGESWQKLGDGRDRMPASNAPVAEDSLRQRIAADQVSRALERMREWQQLRQSRNSVAADQTVAYAGRFEQPDPTHRLYRGDPMSPREVVAPDALQVLGSLGLQTEAAERDRRAAFAKWIVAEARPLTARVVVNRIWQHHFGRGLVGTPSDFGANGARPTHPELLDWLAAELIRGGWSLKHIHRLILTSSTYQQSSAPNPAALRVDGDSRLLWRFPLRRLEAEVIRDNMLAASGVLDVRMGGAGFNPFVPNDNYVRVYKPKTEFGPLEWRRMVYAFNVRMERDGVFGAFDCPDAGQVTPNRNRSTTAIQALNLFNSEFTLQQAGLFAERLERTTDGDVNRVVSEAFRIALSRPPTMEEANAAQELVATGGTSALCRALFNSNEFLFLP